jgi:hypothetical protein
MDALPLIAVALCACFNGERLSSLLQSGIAEAQCEVKLSKAQRQAAEASPTRSVSQTDIPYPVCIQWQL